MNKNKQNIGDIVRATIVFPDNDEMRSRYLVIVGREKNYYYACNLTRSYSYRRGKEDSLLSKEPVINDDTKNGLTNRTYVKTNVLYELQDSMIHKQIGVMEKEKVTAVIRRLQERNHDKQIVLQYSFAEASFFPTRTN